GTMVTHSIFTALANHFGLHAITHTQVALFDVSIMHDQALQWVACILHMEDSYGTSNITPITDLTTALSIEWSPIEDDKCVQRSADTLSLFAIYNEPDDFATTSDALIARELTRTHTLEDLREGTIIS